MNKPYVICHMLTALDGKIDGSFFGAPECGPASRAYGDIRGFYGCQATLYGTTTMLGGYSEGLAGEFPPADNSYPKEDYLAYLRKFDISYIFAGRKQLDCRVLLEKLYRMFSIEKLMVAGGGLMNWSFVQEGLLDELSLVIAPVADGNTTSVSIFEKSDFLPAREPAAFELKEVKQLEGSCLWLRYLAK